MSHRLSVSTIILTIIAALAACSDATGPELPPAVNFSLVGHGEVSARFTSDLWVHGDYAYTGTVLDREQPGNIMYVWDISDPSAPVRVDSVQIDARRLNDVKVSADGGLAVITHEQSADGLNGITLLDLSDPAHPTVITRYTTNLESGVHNVWIEGDYVYAAQDGPPGVGRLRVLDISDPGAPFEVADFADPDAFLHDVYVRDGLAFLSFWDAGLIILDVGNGIRGGSPSDPVEVSRIALAGETHNAWYWPDGGYVFVGEEDNAPGSPPVQGILHVVDVSDLENPQEVATFQTAQNRATPHNFWVDEQNRVLFAAWYSEGLVALDITGELSGRLEQQDRILDIAAPFPTGRGCFGGPDVCIWAPQLHRGLVYASDANHGLLVLDPGY